MKSLEDLFLDHVDTYSAADTGQSFDLSVLGDGLVFTRWVPDQVQPMEADEIHGELDGHTFYMVGDEFSVAIGSQGWEIRLDQAPSSKPAVVRLGGRVKSVAALDPAFIERATQLLTIRARRMHAEVACQWPRRSTMPDQKGRALHPLDRGLSAEWHCLHCDGAHDGQKSLALPGLRSDTNRHLPRTILEWDQAVRLTASCALTGPAEIAGQTLAPATSAEGQRQLFSVAV